MAGFEVNEEIHIALGRRFTPRKRPEGTQMTDAVPLGGVEQSASPAPQLVCLRAELTSN